jgi:predicted O-methyltransferase YrrM
MNCAAPERKALEFLWPKLSSGGIIVLDDYCFSGREAQQISADKFAHSVGTRVLSLPTGQGLLIKA